MSKVINYTPEEAILIARAGVIAGAVGLTSTTLSALNIAEESANFSNLTGLFLSIFAFLPSAVIWGLYIERYWGKDPNNTSLARVFFLTIVILGAGSLIVALIFPLGTKLFGIVTIAITLLVAWWLWPRLPDKPNKTLK